MTNKMKYERPETNVIEIEYQSLICASGRRTGGDPEDAR